MCLWNLDFWLKKLGRRVDIPAGVFCFPKSTSQKKRIVGKRKNTYICCLKLYYSVLFRSIPFRTVSFCIIPIVNFYLRR